MAQAEEDGVSALGKTRAVDPPWMGWPRPRALEGGLVKGEDWRGREFGTVADVAGAGTVEDGTEASGGKRGEGSKDPQNGMDQDFKI